MASYRIHASAVVGPHVQVGEDVEIGPRCVVEGPVTLGAGVRLVGGVSIQGPATIGAGTVIYPNASLGFPAQDLKLKPGDGAAGVVVGSACQIRENVTIHGPTKDQPTRVGDRCFLMVSSHVGHDVQLGEGVILVNNVMLAGHVRVADGAQIAGGAGVHQGVRIGRGAFIGGLQAVTGDVPPYMLMMLRNQLTGLNVVGLRRGGTPRSEIDLLRRAFKEAFVRSLPRAEMVAILRDLGQKSEKVAEIAEFVASATRHLARAWIGAGDGSAGGVEASAGGGAA